MNNTLKFGFFLGDLHLISPSLEALNFECQKSKILLKVSEFIINKSMHESMQIIL